MPNSEVELARAHAFRLYSWRLKDYAQSAGYQGLAREIAASRAKIMEDPCWDKFLGCLALVETFERRTWFRAVERVVYHVSMKKARVTLGVFQMQDAPWEVPDAVKLVIDRLLEAGIKPSFCNENLTQLALHWYGHAAVEPRAAFSYPDAMRAAERVLTELSQQSPWIAYGQTSRTFLSHR